MRRAARKCSRAQHGHPRAEGLQGQNKTETVLDIVEELASKAAGWLAEKISVDGDDLRDVRYRVLRETCRLGWNQDIPRRLHKAQVGCENNGNDGAEPAAVECVVLHNQHRSAKPGFGAARLAQVRPPDLAALDYHALRSSDRRCKRRTPGSNPLSCVA